MSLLQPEHVHCSLVCLISKPFISSYAFLWTHSSLSLFKHMISKTEHKPQVGLDGATQSSKSGFFLFTFHLKSRCIKVFAFIGNRLFLILLCLLPTVFNIRAFGTINLPLVLIWTDYSFDELFYMFLSNFSNIIKVILYYYLSSMVFIITLFCSS